MHAVELTAPLLPAGLSLRLSGDRFGIDDCIVVDLDRALRRSIYIVRSKGNMVTVERRASLEAAARVGGAAPLPVLEYLSCLGNVMMDPHGSRIRVGFVVTVRADTRTDVSEPIVSHLRLVV